MTTRLLLPRWAAGLLLATLASGSALAQDVPAASAGPELSWSAFGTLGLTRGDQPWRYQRFIRDAVDARRDSVLGGQLDLQLNDEWSATVQARLAPAEDRDHGWALVPSWAFVAWRPGNDWLVRAGKMRVPFFLRSEQLDVGQTYDEARLPTEVYTLAPTSDFAGLNVSRSVSLDEGELSIDAYVGNTRTDKRSWARGPIPSPVPGAPDLAPAGAQFRNANVDLSGLVLTWRDPERTVRLGAHRLDIGLTGGAVMPVRPVWAALGPGLGYWQTSPLLPGPGVATLRKPTEWMFSAGIDQRLPQGWRTQLELARIRQGGTVMALDAWVGAATLSRSWGPFTPYLGWSAARSTPDSLRVVRDLESTTVPAAVPGAALLNASMRYAADSVLVYDQHSLALGSSWALGPTTKLKLEWMQTRARLSTLIDVPAGEPLERPRRVNVLSLSYSFVY